MSVDRANPINLQTVGNYVTEATANQVQDLWVRIIAANDARQEYLRKQEKLLRQRKGIRRPKSFPWPGANNHNWPLTDAVCRRWKPGIVSLVLQSDPVCYFFARSPDGYQAAPIAQDYYDWRFKDITGIEEIVLENADNVFQYGKSYMEVGWEYSTQRQCRLARTADLFPGGPQQALQNYNQSVQQKQAQVSQAVAQGQADPSAMQQIPPQLDLATFIQSTLEQEYLLKPDLPVEFKQIQDATQAILRGADVVKFYYQTVRADKPALMCHSPLTTIIPPRCNNLSDADFIAFEYNFSQDNLRVMALDGHLDRVAVEKVCKFMESRSQGDPYRAAGVGALAGSTRRMINDVLDRAEGLTPGMIREPDLEPVYKIYCKVDLDNDGIDERCVLWYHFGSSDTDRDTKGTILALYPLPAPFGEWPVTSFEFEHTSARPYQARGGAELLSVFQATANKIHNARLDAIQVTLSPMLVMRVTAGDEPRNIKFMPGAIIPVSSVADIAPLKMDASPLVHLLQEENFTKGLAEQYIGVFDPGILAENAADRRTATEVDAVTQQTQSIFGQDAVLQQSGWRKVHRHVWLYDQEFAPEELWYRVSGDPKPHLAKKYELAYDYDIVPAGSPANTNMSFARKKALEMIQLFGPDMTGLIDKRALFLNYFNVMDRNLGKLVVRDEQQAALFQYLMQTAQKMAANQGQPPQSVPPPP